MPAPEIVLRLIDQFDRNLDAYRSGHYNEAQVRAEFIDPLFEALGWDIYNKEANAEAYKDVVHEDAVKVGGSTKAPITAFASAGPASSSWKPRNPRSISRATRTRPTSCATRHYMRAILIVDTF